MNGRDILLRESQLEQLISLYESKIAQISSRFEEIKSKTSIVDGNPDNWESEAQQIFKEKKDNYVNSFETVTSELNKQLNLMKQALQMLKENEQAVTTNVDMTISDVV